MRKVLHGDRVVARISGVDRRGRPEGKIVEVLERANRRIVGRLHSEHGVLFVAPEDRRISQDFLVPPGDAAGGAQPGQVVIAEIIAQPSQARAAGRRAWSRCSATTPIPAWRSRSRCASTSCRTCFRARRSGSARALAGGGDGRGPPTAASTCASCRSSPSTARRRRISTTPSTASRSADTKKQSAGKGGFRLVVAIADVSHYVKHGDALDRDARERGNSVYFPRRVIPMLPEKLSNGLCSLNPQVDRLAMVCDMRIDAGGEIGAYKFYPAVFRSHARLTYTEVAAMLEDRAGEAARRHARAPAAYRESVSSLQGARERAHAARRDRFRDDRDRDDVRRAAARSSASCRCSATTRIA